MVVVIRTHDFWCQFVQLNPVIDCAFHLVIIVPVVGQCAYNVSQSHGCRGRELGHGNLDRIKRVRYTAQAKIIY